MAERERERERERREGGREGEGEREEWREKGRRRGKNDKVSPQLSQHKPNNESTFMISKTNTGEHKSS